MLRLKHMIVSHHGEYEYGSPKLPMTLEAVALYCLDNLDAKVNSLPAAAARRPERRQPLDGVQPEPGPEAVQGAAEADECMADHELEQAVLPVRH